MSPRIFESLTKLATNLPAEAVVHALDVQCKMIQNDLDEQRLNLSKDILSILYFSQFVRMAKFGEAMRGIVPLPPDHIEFYKETIVRLVHAGELQPAAMKLFDETFLGSVEKKKFRSYANTES